MPFIGNTPQTQSFAPAIDYFSGNGVTVTFTLSRPVVSVAQLTVAVDNVIQNPSSAFTVSGNSITFTSAPLSGTNNIWVEYTSLITTYAAISQDPSVIGDISATGGFLAEGDFGNTYIDGTVVDYVTGNARITTGPIDDMTFYHGGTFNRSEMMRLSYAGNSTLTGNLAISGSASVQGLTVGKGGGAVTNNTAFGLYTLGSNTSGAYNTGVGQQALYLNTTGSYNTAVGFQSFALNTTGGNNTALGNYALFANTTASNNTAVGFQSLFANTTGTANVGVGQGSLVSNTTGGYNVSIGLALVSNTTGSQNVGIGYQAGNLNTTANWNTFIGYQTGYYNQTGQENTYLGMQAGFQSTGDSNVMIGYYCGASTTTGANNILVGRSAQLAASGNTYCINIGANSVGKGSNTGFINPNGGGVFQGNNSSSWSTTSDRRLKKNIVDNTDGLNKITAIQVRNFEYRLPEEVTELEPTCAIEKAGVQLGVIAQELAEVLPECVKTESTGVMSVDTDNLTWYLINAVKEQQAMIEELKTKVAALEAK
jgi:hypothetical protein